MGLKNCPQCGKLFLDNPVGLCPECVAQEERDEARVGEYLREVKTKASIDEIHEATGVKHKVILRMIRSGRVVSDFAIEYPCESCGAPISEGRVCQNCSKNILDQLKTEDWKKTDNEPVKKYTGSVYTKNLFRKN
ncbi:Hypothetical protein LUCI_4721 [Lucifera butyrica]|uniref:Uncharacterized protein n=1 Tax=Lucifera butyrica TaxID=1351585 RepID=A0A498RD96_9FIRM|nr:flagellar protein [Lucifera butyrica]VBB09431.1 Hypothetical protein LUCI_4721 [Lucifera butyrica]